MKIVNWKKLPYIQPVDGLKKRVPIGPEDGAEYYVMRIFEMQPGITSSRHQHDWDHGIFIIEGEGIAITPQGKKIAISEGDVIYIPPNMLHSLENTGKLPLIFMCLVPPRGDK